MQGRKEAFAKKKNKGGGGRLCTFDRKVTEIISFHCYFISSSVAVIRCTAKHKYAMSYEEYKIRPGK